MKNRTRLLAAALAVTLFAPMLHAENCIVKLGSVGPLTGAASAWGLAHKAGPEFIAALTNEAGGLSIGGRKCRVEVVPYDSQYTAAGGAAASNYLANEDVHAVIGPVGAPEHTGFKNVAKRYKQLSFTPTFAADALSPDFPLVFHENQGPAAWGMPVAREAVARFKFKSVMVIGPNDQTGTDIAKVSKPIYEKLGVKVFEEYYQRGTVNFLPIVQRILNQSPEAIEMAAVPPADMSVLVRQFIEAGFQGVFGVLGGSGPAAVVLGAGGEKNLKALYWVEFVPLDDPGLVRMRADYQRLMKQPAPENTLFYTSAIATEQVLHAMSIAGTSEDGDRIATALRSSPPNSIYLGKGNWRGRSQFGINQELAFPAGMGMIVDGKRQVVQRIDVVSE